MSKSGDTIQRCPHDEENPYTQVLNALIRDNNISPNCRMIIIYLLSNKNNWTIRVPQLLKEFKKFLGKDAMYKIINEAIEAGYILRQEYSENNLRRYRYFLSEKPKFKKCFRHPDFQDTGFQDAEKPDSKERTSEEKTSNKKEHLKESKKPIVHNSSPPKAPHLTPSSNSIDSIPFQRKDYSIDLSSPELYELLDMEPQYKDFFRPEILTRWIGKFGPKMVLDNVKFFLHVKSTQKKPIPKPEAWMESAFKKNYAEIDKTSQENKQFAEKLKKEYRLARLKINKRYCQDTETGKDFYYYLPPDVFQRALQQLAD